MSVFTDDDLRRLKEYVENNPEPSEWFEGQKALLNRLECAEQVCAKAQQLIYGQGAKTANDMIHEFDEALDAHRKSSGR